MKKKYVSKRKRIRCAVIFFMVLVLIFIACDMRLKTVIYHVESEKVDKPVKIALITDLHSCRYGKGQHMLIDAVDEQKPDVVLLGGDIFDDRLDYDNAKTTLEYLSEKYPCYYVTGNHEYWSKDIENILSIVKSYGITNLSGECEALEINGEIINICGVDDPDVSIYTRGGKETDEQLKAAEAAADARYFTILLTHRPELIEIYRQYDFDLILSGHAHGGQWRIPYVLNGLFAPDQGMFPDYAGGRYSYEGKTMIVSRGLARESTLAPRIFNRPELVIIEIE